MGCDIHPYVEYVIKNYQDAYCFAELSMDRDYWLFHALAGVRGSPLTGDKVGVPKGMPDNPSSTVQGAYYLIVSDDRAGKAIDGDRYVTMEDAKKYEQHGASFVIRPKRDDGWTPPVLLSGPDYHSASYLNVEELKKIRENYLSIEDERISESHELNSVIAMMEALERPDVEARFVFWFDN